ncbi:hypothetical protein BOX15_Mlig033504g5 [Macrostomum lignano]|uniref:Reverse transcriptase n=1 Tax=Macrostomum lignano TaxID=282301 RepID=A0A267GNS8_9PLAT|nr:hypothetical protein BOX15_Mlig033504g5 [Macrostomum lignano]
MPSADSSGHGSHSSSSANRRLAKEIIQSVKSSGLFDELRRDCAAKLESRSGYSRLINQLKPLTKKHLDRVVWEPGLNKVATRERLRRRLLDTPAVQSMLDDLLDQLLSHNAVQTSIQPRVDRAIADYAGVTPEELRQMRRQLPLLPTPNEQQQQHPLYCPVASSWRVGAGPSGDGDSNNWTNSEHLRWRGEAVEEIPNREIDERMGWRATEIVPIAMDVERNPGPCGRCSKVITSGHRPIKCQECNKDFHGACTGLTRSAQERARQQPHWRCSNCQLDGQWKEESDAEERARWERDAEAIRNGDSCSAKGCKTKLKITKVIVRCKECHGLFHNKCSGASRASIEGEVRRGKWSCTDCLNRIRLTSEEASATDDQNTRTGEASAGWAVDRKSTLRILQWNADGVNNKRAELEEFLHNLDVDVAVLQESKLSEASETPRFRGYTTVRKDRREIRRSERARGGGLITLIKHNIPFKRLTAWKGNITEGLRTIVDISKKERIVITNVYRPPIRTVEGEDDRDRDSVWDWMSPDRREIILGDFNLHSAEWGATAEQSHQDQREAQELLDWSTEFQYQILNDGTATRTDWRTGAQSSPDVSLAAPDICMRCKWSCSRGLSSDHHPIIIDITAEREVRKIRKRLAWSWKKADWTEYQRRCEEAVTAVPRGPIAQETRALSEAMVQAAVKCIPKKRVGNRYMPFWDEQLAEAQALRDKESRENSDSRARWHSANETLSNLIKEKRSAFWREHVSKLQEGDDGKSTWRLIKTLHAVKEDCVPNEIVVNEGREARTDKEKAAVFINLYASNSKVQLGKEERALRAEVAKKLRTYNEGAEFSTPFTREELKDALDQMAADKKGGVDGIEVRFLKNLPEQCLDRWLDIFNRSWAEHSCPGIWKKAEIIPLLKAGKDPKQRESYRPISLTPVCAKLMERMVTNRLYFWMEDNKIIKSWQAGFQRGRSTEEQVIRLVQSIQDGWEERRPLKTVAVTLDCSKAYERVWRVKLMDRMLEEKVPAHLVKWFASFLEDRKGRVRVGDETSKFRRFQEGLPQGAVSSPALFLLYANGWNGLTEQGVEYGGFADDLAIWASGTVYSEVRDTIQRALIKIERWAKVLKIELNPTKCECCIFSRSPKDKSAVTGLTIAGRTIATVRKLKYLGITIDGGLTFAAHTEAVLNKMKRRVRAIRVLANTSWGWRTEELLLIYKSIVESCIWYCAPAWLPWLSSTSFEKLERAQRECLRLAAGLVRSTPIEAVYVETNIEPIRYQARKRAMLAWEKATRAPEGDPLRECSERTGNRRLQANKGWRDQAREECLRRSTHPREGFTRKRHPPWRRLHMDGVVIATELIRGGKKGDSNLATETIDTINAWGKFDLSIYTDGSVGEGQRKGGAACVVYFDTERRVKKAAAGEWCSSLVAEERALELALDTIAEAKPRNAIILTDCKSALLKLSSEKATQDTTSYRLISRLREISQVTRVVLQWVPGHVGVAGNEDVDQEAKEAAALPQDDVPVMWNCVKAAIRKEPAPPPSDERLRRVYKHKINKCAENRSTETTLAQLRCGQCKKTAYWRQKIGAEAKASCQDCGEEEDKDHWVWCDRWHKERARFGIQGLEDLGDEAKVLGFLKCTHPEWVQ